MTLLHVDDLVTTWQDKVNVISRNIADLTEAEATKRIQNRMRGTAKPALTGLTLERAQVAFKAIDVLLNDFLLLESVVSQAADLHRRSNLFRSNEEEVRQLLEGASVHLPPTHIPLTKRGLLDAGFKADSATPEEMLNAMLRAFDDANGIINDINIADESLNLRLANFLSETEALRAWAEKVGQQDIITACDELQSANTDPLRAAEVLDSLEQRFDDWRRQLEAAEKEQAQLREGLERARSTIEQLAELSNRCRMAIEETNRGIAGHHSYIEPTSPEAVESHRAWLVRLETSMTTGRWKALQAGLANLEASLDVRMKAEQKAYTHNRKSLDTVTDLKGRFKALKVKAKAYAERGMMLAAALPGIQSNIDNVLNQTQIDVQMLERLVSAYDTALLATSRNK